MSAKDVQYRHAFNSLRELVEIHEAKRTGESYYCPHCGAEMVMRCGNIKEWHFAHKKQKKCEYNHYLHTIAEIKIQEWINTSSEVFLYLYPREYCHERETCHFYNDECIRTAHDPEIYNLKQWYNECEREKQIIVGEHTFVADLLWHHKTNNKLDILIEINVTNPCEERKIKSGARIVEFKIESEENIERLLNSPIIPPKDSRYYNNILLYNFNPKDKPASGLETSRLLQKFILFESDKAYIDNYCCCRNVNKRRGIFEITTTNDGGFSFYKEGSFYNIGYALASQYFPSLKHCSLCKHQTMTVENDIICKLRVEREMRFLRCKNAAFCREFIRDEEIIKRRIDLLREFGRTNYVDVWKK